MESVIVACAQPRMTIAATREEFEAGVRRFLRQSQAKAAQLVIFPELTGVILAPSLISQLKLGFIKQADRGSQPAAGILSRSLGRFSGATADALGGGLLGSLKRLLRKRGDELVGLYLGTWGDLAREFGMTVVGGSVYVYEPESDSVRNRAYVFDTDGTVLGYQDKLNLTVDERELAAPGAELSAIDTRAGRLGILIGRDVLYPELGRLLAIQGVDLFVGIGAAPGAAQSAAARQALSMRVEENQVFAAASFMLGPNHIDRANPTDYLGQSALLAPISLTPKGDGVLTQAGTNRTEALIAAELAMDELYHLRETSRFQPRQEMNLGNMGPVLAEMYRDGLTVEQAITRRLAGPVALQVEPAEFEPPILGEPLAQELPELEPAGIMPDVPEPAGIVLAKPEPVPDIGSVPESMSLTTPSGVTEE